MVPGVTSVDAVGSSSPATTQPTIQAFVPDFAAADVDRMLFKIRDTRIPERDLQPGKGPAGESDYKTLSNWNRGPPITWVQEMMSKWATSWSYDSFLEFIRRWPQFKAWFGEQEVHFIHSKSPKGTAKLAMVLIAGWPSTPYDFNETIEHLHAQSPEPIDIIAPAYPGAAFSSVRGDDGWKMDHFADQIHDLVLALGYKEYVAHGFDWGHYLGRLLANRHPECKALHLSFLPANPLPLQKDGSALDPSTLNSHESSLLERGKWWKERHLSYFLLQCNNAQLLTLALYDNPLGLLSWVGEKWYICSDIWTPSAQSSYSSDKFGLDWLSLIFLSGSAHTSYIPYITASTGNAAQANDPKQYIRTPTGYTSLRYEVMGTSRAGAESSANIVYYKEHDHGGHFGPAECPVEIAQDIIATCQAAGVFA